MHAEAVRQNDSVGATESIVSTQTGPLVRVIVMAALLAIPFSIVSEGFLPDDDALADAGKAVAGRPWSDILVLKDSYRLDPHLGWHALLRSIHLVTGWSAHALLLVAVIGLFTLLVWSAVWWMERPEAWLATLVIVMAATTGMTERYMRGRPLLVSASVLITILWLWQRYGDRAPSGRHVAIMSGLLALSVLLHGSWYLWALPLVAFALARQFAWMRAFALSWAIGIVAGAVLTGHPVGYLVESVRMGLEAFGHHAFERTLVPEFQPMSDDLAGLMLLAGVVVFRRLYPSASRTVSSLAKSPPFWLACLGWVLGYKAMRFWGDWGLVALLVVIASELEQFLRARMQRGDGRRLLMALGLAGALYLIATNDSDSRWTASLSAGRLSAEDPELAGWLPDRGGILYSGEMGIFFQTFYRNPDAPWRYMTGFEPAMMPDADFQTYETIMWYRGAPAAYLPWVAKLRPEDRVALHWPSQPELPALEWKNVQGIWLGRLKPPGQAGPQLR